MAQKTLKMACRWNFLCYWLAIIQHDIQNEFHSIWG